MQTFLVFSGVSSTNLISALQKVETFADTSRKQKKQSFASLHEYPNPKEFGCSWSDTSRAFRSYRRKKWKLPEGMEIVPGFEDRNDLHGDTYVPGLVAIKGPRGEALLAREQGGAGGWCPEGIIRPPFEAVRRSKR